MCVSVLCVCIVRVFMNFILPFSYWIFELFPVLFYYKACCYKHFLTYLSVHTCQTCSRLSPREWKDFCAHLHLAFLVAQLVKASAYNAGDLGSIPGWGRSSGEGNGNPLQYSCPENPMGGPWQATVHGAFSKSSLNIWKFTVHELLKLDLENFEHYFASM